MYRTLRKSLVYSYILLWILALTNNIVEPYTTYEGRLVFRNCHAKFHSLIVLRFRLSRPSKTVTGHFAERHFAEGHLAERHFAEGHLAERHFAERIFCRRTFCRSDILSNGQFDERTFYRKDILPNRPFAENSNIL